MLANSQRQPETARQGLSSSLLIWDWRYTYGDSGPLDHEETKRSTSPIAPLVGGDGLPVPGHHHLWLSTRMKLVDAYPEQEGGT